RGRRELGLATRAGRAGHVDARAGHVDATGPPTRYGPVISNRGTPVIRHACFMPKKMIAALITLDGSPLTTMRTGRTAVRPASVASAVTGDIGGLGCWRSAGAGA